ncbi:MAG TPA: VWA domain-containing protein [Pyrinomonadaceae bacterium]|nr:VWA domain-containing protein [Pyrinomonadaceae bacterium]
MFMLFNGSISAQVQRSPDEITRVHTRVVFVDTLVRDKRTGVPVGDLKREDFEILADGRPRVISYFTRGGSEPNKPLALALVLAPIDDDARNFLRSQPFVKAVSDSLRRLAPGDEVAVIFSRWGGLVPPRILTDFTRDRAQAAAAIESLPDFSPSKLAQGDAGVVHDEALAQTLLSVFGRRPDSRAVVIMITDSIFQMTAAERAEMASGLSRRSVTFNALTTGTDKFFLLSYPILKPAGNVLGLSLYGVPRYLAEQTGGEELRMRKTEDLGIAIEQVISSISARYGLGFDLTADELDDGRMHPLKVKVTARDARGKSRKLKVFARRGYYVPAVDANEASVAK